MFTSEAVLACVRRVRETLYVVARADGLRGVSPDEGVARAGGTVLGALPPLYPEWVGDRSFCQAHSTRFPYVAGEMANGIAGVGMVAAMAKAEMLGFFGAAGLSVAALEARLVELTEALGGAANWGANLIHTPTEPGREDRVVELLLRYRVPRVSMSAFTDLTPGAVRCAMSGLRIDPAGAMVRPVAVFAKVSRPEVARVFMAPPPAELLNHLVGCGQLTENEARLAARVPVAQDVTVEADSGGHTDRRPLLALLPAIIAARDAMAAPVRIGAAGGLGDPASVAAAFALGAAYVLTGSVNQMSVEADTSAPAKQMLARAEVTDVAMAPASDMFELGGNVQVLSRGTMYPVRAARLRGAYQIYHSLNDVPPAERAALEREVIGLPLDEVWALTQEHWSVEDPGQLKRAECDPRHRMALMFRWYLGNSGKWATRGDPDRVADYQLWCGPAAGAFNRWTAGSFLAEPSNRTVTQIARNLLEGAAVITRAHQLRTYGVAVPHEAFTFTPRELH